VDDLKISHVKNKVIDDIITCLSNKFGREGPLTATSGKVLEYLGMTLDYMSKNKVKISMYKYLDKMLTELPTDMNGGQRHWQPTTCLTSIQGQRNCPRLLPSFSIT